MSSKVAAQQLKALVAPATKASKNLSAKKKGKASGKPTNAKASGKAAPATRKALLKAVDAGAFATSKKALYDANKKYFVKSDGPTAKADALLAKLARRRR